MLSGKRAEDYRMNGKTMVHDKPHLQPKAPAGHEIVTDEQGRHRVVAAQVPASDGEYPKHVKTEDGSFIANSREEETGQSAAPKPGKWWKKHKGEAE